MTKILFQGDSITDAGRNREHPESTEGMGCGYPLLIKSKLGCDRPGEFECRNLGIGGNRVVDLYARILRDIVNLKPDVLSILIGVNDVWHGLNSDPNGVAAPKFERVYDWLVQETREALPAVRILIMEPFVLPGRGTQSADDPALWDTFSREVALRAQASRRIAEKHGAAFVPLQAKLDGAARLTPCDHWLGDGVHPTAAGHELIAREWMKAFEELAL